MNRFFTRFTHLLAAALILPVGVAAQVTLFGNFYESKPAGMYSFKSSNRTQTSGVNPAKLATDANMKANGGGIIVDGKFHCVSVDDQYSSFGILAITDYVYDATTWELLDDYGIIGDYVAATCLALNPVSGTVYGQFFKTEGGSLSDAFVIGTRDYATNQTVVLGPAARRYVAMGITSAQRLFAIGADGYLYELSTADGSELSRKGSTGITLQASASAQPAVQSGVIDSRDDTFYWAATNASGQSALYTVSLTNGAVELQTRMPNNSCVAALTVNPVDDNAPAAPAGVAVGIEGTQTTAHVTFTLPAKTADGKSDLTGTLTYSVSVAGTVLASGTGAPGAEVQLDVTLPAGQQTLSVVASNDSGVGTAATQSVFVGLDQPAAPAGVAAAVAGNQITVSWQAPAGVHGGYVGSLTYDVVRYPGQTTVATGLTATTFVDNITTLNSYYYTVVACNSGSASAEPGRSDAVIAGPALQLPYAVDFASAQDFSLYTVIGDEDTFSFWDYVSGSLYFTNEIDNGTNDAWAVTPPLSLDAATVYTLTFQARNRVFGGKSGSSRLQVSLGTSPVAAALMQTVLPAADYDNTAVETFTADFTVAAAGAYYVGFRNLSLAGTPDFIISSVSVAPKGDPAAVGSPLAAARPAAVYTLTGRRVSGAALAPGVYVAGGRKVVVR